MKRKMAAVLMRTSEFCTIQEWNEVNCTVDQCNVENKIIDSSQISIGLAAKGPENLSIAANNFMLYRVAVWSIQVWFGFPIFCVQQSCYYISGWDISIYKKSINLIRLVERNDNKQYDSIWVCNIEKHWNFDGIKRLNMK